MSMKAINNLSLKTKLLSGFLLTALITLIVGFQGYITISNTNVMVEEMMGDDVELLLKAEQLMALGLTHRRYEKDFFLNM